MCWPTDQLNIHMIIRCNFSCGAFLFSRCCVHVRSLFITATNVVAAFVLFALKRKPIEYFAHFCCFCSGVFWLVRFICFSRDPPVYLHNKCRTTVCLCDCVFNLVYAHTHTRNICTRRRWIEEMRRVSNPSNVIKDDGKNEREKKKTKSTERKRDDDDDVNNVDDDDCQTNNFLLLLVDLDIYIYVLALKYLLVMDEPFSCARRVGLEVITPHFIVYLFKETNCLACSCIQQVLLSFYFQSVWGACVRSHFFFVLSFCFCEQFTRNTTHPRATQYGEAI